MNIALLGARGRGIYIHFVRTLARPAGSIGRRSVTSRYLGSTISGSQQNQRRRPRQGERQIMFILTKNNYFVDFFAVVALLRHELYGVGKHNTKIVALFFYT